MEAKKNPAYDLDRQRSKFFFIGLSISIALVITAFEWRVAKKIPKPKHEDPITVELPTFIPSTVADPPHAPVVLRKVEKTPTNSVVPSELVSSTLAPTDDDLPLIDMEQLSSATFSLPNDLPEEIDTTFIFVETKPQPVGGFENFYSYISKHLIYPSPARRMGIEGKVLVEFIINKSGNPMNLKVIRGIGSGCDEEAVKILAAIRWEPGKQRGKAVNVKMILPIHFRLGN